MGRFLNERARNSDLKPTIYGRRAAPELVSDKSYRVSLELIQFFGNENIVYFSRYLRAHIFYQEFTYVGDFQGLNPGRRASYDSLNYYGYATPVSDLKRRKRRCVSVLSSFGSAIQPMRP